MKISLILRTSLLAAALGAALSAQAVGISLTSAGSYFPEYDALPTATSHAEEFVVVQTGGTAPVWRLIYDLPVQSLPRSGAGTFYTRDLLTGLPDVQLNFSLTQTTSDFSGIGVLQLHGTWAVTSGTGAYSGATGAVTTPPRWISSAACLEAKD